MDMHEKVDEDPMASGIGTAKTIVSTNQSTGAIRIYISDVVFEAKAKFYDLCLEGSDLGLQSCVDNFLTLPSYLRTDNYC